MAISRSSVLVAAFLSTVHLTSDLCAEPTTQQILESVGATTGIVAVIDAPGSKASSVMDLLQENELRVYFQSDDPKQVDQVRQLAAAQNLIGIRLFVDAGRPDAIGLGKNIADAVLVATSAADKVSEKELLRVLRPNAVAFVGDRRIVKPVPAGIDEWTHPYQAIDCARMIELL